MAGQAIPCRACERGVLQRRKRYRLGGAVAVLGFLIGVPSLLGLVLAGLLLWVTGKVTVESSAELDRAAVGRLLERGVPAAVASRAVSGPPFSRQELEAMPEEHRRLIEVNRDIQRGTTAGTGIAALLGGGTSLCIGAASFLGVLLGVLLTLTKRVLQCGACGAVLAAS